MVMTTTSYIIQDGLAYLNRHGRFPSMFSPRFRHGIFIKCGHGDSIMIVTGVPPFDVHSAYNKQRGTELMAANLWEFTGLSTAVSGKLQARRVVTAVLFLFGMAWSGILIVWLIWGREKRPGAGQPIDQQVEEMSVTPARVGWSLDLPDRQ
jgi:hypothetical protein